MTTPTTPWLPPELWKDVFAHATYFEGECDIHEWIQRTHPGSDEQTKLELARREIAGEESNRFMLLENPLFRDQQTEMRLSLILVCRDWFQMTAEHFYRSILIRDPSKFHGCVKTLKKHPWICRFVRRLEFSIDEDDTDLLDSRSISAFQRQLTDVIEYCNELVFFRGSVSFDLIDLSLRSALVNHCPNLQLVVGHHALDGYPASTFFRHIPHLSNLVLLQLPPNVGTLAVTHKPPVSLPRLRILDLGNQAPLISIEFGRYLSRWDLPSLDAVHLGTLSPALALHSFWASHGSKLTTIKIYNAQKTTLGRRLAEVNLGITMPSNDLFPNIRQLIILHNPPRALTHLFLPSRSLEIYEVPFHSPWPEADALLTLHLREQLWADHFRHFTPGNSPNLRTVRISSVPLETDEGPAAENWDGLRLDTWRKKFSDQGTELEVVYRPA